MIVLFSYNQTLKKGGETQASPLLPPDVVLSTAATVWLYRNFHVWHFDVAAACVAAVRSFSFYCGEVNHFQALLELDDLESFGEVLCVGSGKFVNHNKRN
jgi:hypothetical protein